MLLRSKYNGQNAGGIRIEIRGLFASLALLLVSTQISTVCAQGKAQGESFLYRGHLNMDGSLANGTYDLAFSLFETSQGGTGVGPITNSLVNVRNGMFAVTLDFGPGPFTNTDYWLDINVRTNGGGAFTELSPRRQLTPSPFAHGPQGLAFSAMQPPQREHALTPPPQNADSGPARTEQRP
jgi:hypothetical protein